MSKSQRLSQASQRSQSSQGTPSQVGGEELQRLAQGTVRFLLMHDYDKVPIKHSDISKYVTKNAIKNAGPVMKLAEKMLRDVYGIRLVDDGQRPNKHYLLLNDLQFQEHIALSPLTQAELTLLAIILSLLFMLTNGRYREAGIDKVKVIEFLKLLQIDMREDHEYFGDVKKTIENFKSQKYLDEVKVLNTDPVKFEYHWGVRAIEEMSPRAALEFASEMYGRENIESWAAHFKAVVEYEAARNR